ncbi:MAG: hypothetical protein WC998_04235 [Candidatus Paceibacterota bacterium]|jgi:hypothetical protein
MVKRLAHPELQEGEILLSNSTRKVFQNEIFWKTKRMGSEIYGPIGQPIQQIDTKNRLFPIFVKEEELRNAGVPIEE